MGERDAGSPATGALGPVEVASLFEAIVASTDDAVISFDLHGLVLSWNDAARRLYGFSSEEMLGRSADRLLPDPTDLRRSVALIAAGEAIRRAETRRLTKSGAEIVVEESLSPVHDEAGRVVAVASIAHDVTERRRMEAELAATRAELERNLARLERSNAELEQFAYVASHDLSEPLRAVAGMVQLLGKRYRGRLDADADEFIAFATDGCARMRTMIEDILAYSRVSRAELHVGEVPLQEGLSAVITSLASPIEESGATIVADGLPVVRGDARQLHQVLQNLVGNAVKFRSGTPPRIEVSASRQGAAWCVAVADNGIGIEEQYRDRIFRMFQRLHAREEHEGTGIGLAIAERIVDRHGGRIWVEERPGGGSVFAFTLPDDLEVPL